MYEEAFMEDERNVANERRLIDTFTLAEEIESITITVTGEPARWN